MGKPRKYNYSTNSCTCEHGFLVSDSGSQFSAVFSDTSVRVFKKLPGPAMSGQDQTQMSWFHILPVEIILHVFRYLPLQLGKLQRVCKLFYNAANDSSLYPENKRVFYRRAGLAEEMGAMIEVLKADEKKGGHMSQSRHELPDERIEMKARIFFWSWVCYSARLYLEASTLYDIASQWSSSHDFSEHCEGSGFCCRTLCPVRNPSSANLAFPQYLRNAFGCLEMKKIINAFGNTSYSLQDLEKMYNRVTSQFGDSFHARHAKRNLCVLHEMIQQAESRRLEEEGRLCDLSAEEEIRELIFQLQTQGGNTKGQRLFSDPFFCDQRGENSPAFRLIKIGLRAIPILIEHIDDHRFTRTLLRQRSLRVLMVGEGVLKIISQISGIKKFDCAKPFYDEEEQDMRQMKQQVREWWATYQSKGEKTLLIEEVLKGNDDSCNAASVLLTKYPDEWPVVATAIEGCVNTFARKMLLRVVDCVNNQNTTELLIHEMKTAPSLETRVFAARLLRKRDHNILEDMIEEWERIMARSQTPEKIGSVHGLTDLLALSDEKHTLTALHSLLMHFDRVTPREKLCILDSLKTRLAKSIRLGENEAVDMIEPFLVECLDDADTAEGSFVLEAVKDKYSEGRICDVAGAILCEKYGHKYLYSDLQPYIPMTRRDKAIAQIKNMWRKYNNLPALPEPNVSEVSVVPESDIRLLLKLIEDSQSSEEERSTSLARLQAKGIGVLPSIKSVLLNLRLNDNTKNELIAIATRLTWTPRRLTVDSQSLKKLERTKTLTLLMRLQSMYLSANEIAAVMVDFSKTALPEGCVGLHIRGDRSTDLEGLLLDANLVLGDGMEQFTNSVVGWEVSIFVSVGTKILERTLKSTLGGLSRQSFSHLVTGFQEAQSKLLEEPFTFSVSLKRFHSQF